MHRPVRRPDAAEARPSRWKTPACRSSAPRPTPSTWPRTASGSSSCCTSSDIAQPINAIARSRRRGRARRAQGRLSGGDPPLLRAGRPRPWRSSATTSSSTATSPHAVQVVRRQPGADRPVPLPRHRGGRRRPLRRRRPCSSPASWSTSRRPGVHSGDSACSLPPFSLTPETIAELKRQTEAMARALNVRGLMNVQFAIEEPHSAEPAHLRAGGQPARQPHRALRRQDHRRARWPPSPPRSWPASRWPSFGLNDDPPRPHGGEGGGLPLRPLPRRRHRAGPRDALHRRGDGPGLGAPGRGRLQRPPSPAPSPRASWAAAWCCPSAARCSSRCKDADKPWIVEPVRLLVGLGFTVARHRRHRRPTCASRASRSSRSRRCWRAAPTSSTP